MSVSEVSLLLPFSTLSFYVNTDTALVHPALTLTACSVAALLFCIRSIRTILILSSIEEDKYWYFCYVEQKKSNFFCLALPSVPNQEGTNDMILTNPHYYLLVRDDVFQSVCFLLPHSTV